MLCVATALWKANEKSRSFSRGYDEEWVNRLYRGFQRHLSLPHRFVVFVDERRKFTPGVEQELLVSSSPDYGCLVEPFRLNEPTIIVGLDTVLVGSVSHLGEHCLSAPRMALPRVSGNSNNGVVLVPAGSRRVSDEWRGENDMEWICRQPHDVIDDLWPGHVVSYKLSVRPNGLGDARIVYFHGHPKPNELGYLDWVTEHWR